MTSFLALVALRTLVITAQVSFQADVKDSTRAGNSFTPAADANTAGVSDYNLAEIMSPGVQLTGTFANHQQLLLRYSPNFFYIRQFEVAGASWDQPISTLHRGQINYSVGDPRSLAFSIGGNIADGKLELSSFGAVAGAAGGTVGTAAQSPVGQITQYFGVNGYVSFAKEFGRDWTYANEETFGKISSDNGNNTTDANNVNAANSAVSLQNEISIFSRNELGYRIGSRSHLLFNLQLSDIQFTGLSNYYGVLPQIGWSSTLSDTTNLKAHFGMLVFLQTATGEPDYVSDLLAFDFNFQHTFSELRLPKLHTQIILSLGPFYDLIFGTLEPRATLTLDFSYDFTQHIHGQFGLRGISGEYLTSSGWVPVLPGRTKNMAIVNIGMNFEVTKWLALDLGIYADDRTFAPFANEPSELQEYYGIVGFTGTWHTGRGPASVAPSGGGSGGSTFSPTPLK